MNTKLLLSTTLIFLLAASFAPSLHAEASLTPIAEDTHERPTLTVVVHGLNPNPGDLEPLAHWLDTRGLRTMLFEYDDGLPLARTGTNLARHVARELAARPADRLLIIAHSMGGLVARHAVTDSHSSGLSKLGIPVDLVTIATPHGGVKAANMSLITFGIGRRSFRDLGTWSNFIREPGTLGEGVRHVKVVTNETGTRRRDGSRETSDDVVAQSRQAHPVVDASVAQHHVVPAGHVGILNQDGRLPNVLAGILESVIETDRDASTRIAG